MEEEGMIGMSAEDPNALWELPTTTTTLRTHQGQRISSDRFEGHVTVFAITPLLPGMAVYFYELLEHLHSVFAPKVEFVKAKEEEKKRKAGEKKIKKEADTKRKADENKKKAKEAKRMRVNK